MGRKQPRILGRLRNPLLPQTSPLYFLPASVHLLPSQTSSLHPAFYVHPLSVFYATTFPSLRNTSYFPTLMMAMPSSSCLSKVSSKHPAFFTRCSYSSALMTASPQRAPPDRCLVPLSHQEASCLSVSLKPQTASGLSRMLHFSHDPSSDWEKIVSKEVRIRKPFGAERRQDSHLASEEFSRHRA